MCRLMSYPHMGSLFVLIVMPIKSPLAPMFRKRIRFSRRLIKVGIAASAVMHARELMEIIVLVAQLALDLERAALVDPLVVSAAVDATGWVCFDSTIEKAAAGEVSEKLAYTRHAGTHDGDGGLNSGPYDEASVVL